jgi:hypothetical protein
MAISRIHDRLNSAKVPRLISTVGFLDNHVCMSRSSFNEDKAGTRSGPQRTTFSGFIEKLKSVTGSEGQI